MAIAQAAFLMQKTALVTRPAFFGDAGDVLPGRYAEVILSA